MAKTKILNSLISNLAHSYFSTLNYWEKGYLCDWLVNAANDLEVDNVKIDVLQKRIFPKEMEIKPLMYHLDSLIGIIEKTLKSNDLPENFIKEAIFEITITDRKFISCGGYAQGKNERIYSSKPYTEESFETFKVFGLTHRDKTKNLFRKLIGKIRLFLFAKFRFGKLRYTKRIENL